MKDHRGHGTVMNGFLDGFLPEVGSYAARSVLHRLEDILNSEGLNKYEQEVMKYVFRPDDGEKLAEVRGLDSVLEDLEEEVLHPMLYQQHLRSYSDLLGPVSGLLLYGPTGTGKSSIVRVLAYNVKSFALLNIPSGLLKQRFVGESESLIEAIFSVAKRLQPCLIFVDEVDYLCGKREKDESNHERSLKSALLTAWDGVSAVDADGQRHPILFIGATNRRKDLDSAFLRRFTVQKHIGLPNADQREQILRFYLRSTKVAPSFDYTHLARRMEDFNGSLIKDSCQMAVKSAVRGVLLAAVNQTHKSFAEKDDLASRTNENIRVALKTISPLTESHFRIEEGFRNEDSDLPTKGHTAWPQRMRAVGCSTVRTILFVLLVAIVAVIIATRVGARCHCCSSSA